MANLEAKSRARRQESRRDQPKSGKELERRDIKPSLEAATEQGMVDKASQASAAEVQMAQETEQVKAPSEDEDSLMIFPKCVHGASLPLSQI